MITLLVTALFTQQSSTLEVLPFRWERAQRVSIEVVETENKIDFEYGVELKIFKNAKDGGITIHRDSFEATSIAGRVVEKDKYPLQMREWGARMRHVPNLCIDGAGKLKYLTRIERSEEAFLKEMTEDREGDEVELTPFQYKPGEDREEWSELRREYWQRLSEWWTGLPVTPGTHSVDRKLYLGMPRLKWLDVQVLVEVGESFEEHGRQLVRIDTVLRLNEDVLGAESLRYLRFIGANPSELGPLQDFETFYRDNATFDRETWLPTEVHTSRKTRLGMATTRAAWVEIVLDKHHYELDWDLRESDK